MNIRIKRIYDEAEEADNIRILVDRLWPRGIKKEKANLDLWAKEISPSETLRKSFNHEIDKYESFKKEYMEELDNNEYAKMFKEKYINEKITLVYSAKDQKHNNALVLMEWLNK